jgi:hypothetical protein
LHSQNSRLAKSLRWAGRALGTIGAAFFVAMLIGSAAAEGVGPITIETGILAFLGVIALAGGIVSWWKDVTSGILLFLTSVGLGIHISCYAGHNHFLAWLTIGLPYLVACILMISSWRLSREST